MVKKVITTILLGVSLVCGIKVGSGLNTKVDASTTHIVQDKQIQELKEYAKQVVPMVDKDRVEVLTIEIIKGELESKYNHILKKDDKYSNTLGFHDVSKDKIVLETNDKNILDTFTHELGHFIDITYVNGEVGQKYSHSKEFKKAYKEECERMFGKEDYCNTNIKEYFAQCFSEYVNGVDFSKQAPLTYKYIKGLF